MTALAKALAICAGTVGGAAACVATGVVPAPLLDSPAHHQAPPAKVTHHRHLAEDLEVTPTTYETGSPTESNEAEVEPEPQSQETQAPTQETHKEPEQAERDPEEAPIEEQIAETPSSESGATEYTESAAPPPVSETAVSASPSQSSGGGSSSGSSSSGSAAGEFGP
jgi:hypothetical protein